MRISNTRTVNYSFNNHVNYPVTLIFRYFSVISNYGKLVSEKDYCVSSAFFCDLEREDNSLISHFKGIVVFTRSPTFLSRSEKYYLVKNTTDVQIRESRSNRISSRREAINIKRLFIRESAPRVA